ncbi:MAG: hypothetical protein ACRCZB_07720, partial [Bacteroidales bacterium]
LLNYFWKINEQAKLDAGVGLMWGRNGPSSLDWYEGNDPRPDYYRKLPSYWNTENKEFNKYPNPAVGQALMEQWRANNTSATQLNWEALYEGNYIANANKDRAAEEWQAINVVREYRNDQRTMSGFATYTHNFPKTFRLQAGVEAKNYVGSFYQELVDMLGADYYYNIDKFVLGREIQPDDISDAYLNVLEKTDEERRKRVGDRYGYDYDIHQNDVKLWTQVDAKTKWVDAWLALNGGYTEFWRDGKMKNGRFRNESYGTSDTKQFTHYGVKAGVTAKLPYRNYLSLTAAYVERPPLFRNTFINARYHDRTFDSKEYAQYGLKSQNEEILSGDITYQYRGTRLRAKLAGFYTLQNKTAEVRTFYMEGIQDNTKNSSGALVQYVSQGVDKLYSGIEAGLSYKLTSTITVEAAASYAAYTYNSDPKVSVIYDSDATPDTFKTAMLTGYNVGGRPQAVASATISYRSPKYWYVGLTGNLAAETYIDMSYDRRTAEALKGLSTQQRNAMIHQERFPVAYTLDIFCGYSYKIKNAGIMGVNAN